MSDTPKAPTTAPPPAGDRRSQTDSRWDGYMAVVATFTALLALVVAACETLMTYEVADNEESRAVFRKVFRENEKRVGTLICYCSVLDQCWLAGGGGRFETIDPDEEVDDCPIAKADQFEQ